MKGNTSHLNIRNITQNLFNNNIRSNLNAIKKKPLLNSADIYEKYPYEHVHYSFINLGMKIANENLISHSQICQQILERFKKIVLQTNKEDVIFTRYMENKIEVLRQILSEFIQFDRTMNNIFNVLLDILGKINLEATFKHAKIWFADKIDEHIDQKFVMSEQLVIENASQLIKENDNILIAYYSTIIEKTIINRHQQGISFVVYLVFEKENKLLKKSALFLEQNGIKVVCTSINNIAYFFNFINKVFVSGVCMYSNGYLLSYSGMATIALFAKKFRKPFYVIIRSFKFCSKTQIDSLMVNESNYDEMQPQLKVKLNYDLVPNRLISLLVTEIGLMPPTTVPVILREMNYDFDKIFYDENN